MMPHRAGHVRYTVLLCLALAAGGAPGMGVAGEPGCCSTTDPLVLAAGDADFKAAHPLSSVAPPGLVGVEVKLPGGAIAYLSRAKGSSSSAVILIPEWWGLNDHIKAQADRVAALGHHALAVDLYGGRVATDPDTAGKLMKAVDAGQAAAVLDQAVTFVRSGPQVKVDKVATMGWCFGGGWSLRTAVAAGSRVDACVIFYGEVKQDAAALSSLSAPVLGLFARKDKWITVDQVNAFADAMKKAGKSLQLELYDADHAFANPSGPRFAEGPALEAWKKVEVFLAKHLGK